MPVLERHAPLIISYFILPSAICNDLLTNLFLGAKAPLELAHVKKIIIMEWESFK